MATTVSTCNGTMYVDIIYCSVPTRVKRPELDRLLYRYTALKYTWALRRFCDMITHIHTYIYHIALTHHQTRMKRKRVNWSRRDTYVLDSKSRFQESVINSLSYRFKFILTQFNTQSLKYNLILHIFRVNLDYFIKRPDIWLSEK